MSETKVNNENYVNIQGWMINELNLKSNELIVYAIIYGFTQKEGQVFNGGISYIADWINSTRQTAMNVIKSLEEKGLILKVHEGDVTGKKNTYITTKSLVKKMDYYKNLPSQEIILDLVKIFNKPSQNFLHNIINIIYKNKDDAEASIIGDLKLENPEDKPNDELDEKAVEFKNNIHELREIAVNSTGLNKIQVDGVIRPYTYKDIDLTILLEKIKQSDFLMGKCENKPTIAHFTQLNMLNKILADYYKNKVNTTEQPISKDLSRKRLW